MKKILNNTEKNFAARISVHNLWGRLDGLEDLIKGEAHPSGTPLYKQAPCLDKPANILPEPNSLAYFVNLTKEKTLCNIDTRWDTSSWPCQGEAVSETVGCEADFLAGICSDAAPNLVGAGGCQGWGSSYDERLEVKPNLKFSKVSF